MRRTNAAATRLAVLTSVALLTMMVLLIQACTTESVTDVVVTSVSVQPATATLIVGETRQLDARVVDENGVVLEAAVVGWSVGQGSGAASVDADGLVTALSEGTTTIRATFRDAVGTATLTILPAPTIGVLPSSVTLYGGVDGPDPDPTVLEVINGGEGPLGSLSATVSFAGGPEGWLTAELAGDAAPTELELLAESTGLAAGVYEAVVTVTSPDAPDEPTDVPVSFSLTGFTLTESEGGTIVTEEGGSDEIGVELDVRPESDVVLTVVSADTDEATVSPTTLTFTPENWDTSQTITVTGVDDSELDGNQQTEVTVAVDPDRSDRAYDPAVDRSVSVTTLEGDSPGFLVRETDAGTAVTEDGGGDSLSVVLTSRPAAEVAFTVASSDTGEATAAPSELTFTPADWNEPQAIVVTGVDDDLVDGPQTSTVTVAVDDESSDPAFQDLPDQSVEVTTSDNDGAALVLVESGESTVVTEAGGRDSVTVALAAQPSADVVVDVTSGDEGEVTVGPATLTFTSANWETPQLVTFTGVDDALDDGDEETTVTFEVDDDASDPAFAGANGTVEVATIDDDGVGLVLAGDTSPEIAEAGGTAEFTVALATEPADDVVISVLSQNTDEVTTSPTSLTFTAGNWDAPQTVRVTGEDDDVVDGDAVTQVLVVVTPASDPAYRSVAAREVNVTTTDDDEAGLSLGDAGSLSVTEGGATDEFTVVLDAEPASNVVASITDEPTGQVTLSDDALTFTPANWDEPQTVTITAVDDPTPEADVTVALTVAVGAGSDEAFVGLSEGADVVVTDDDEAGIVLGGAESLSVTEGGATDEFTVVLGAEPASDVVVSISDAPADQLTLSDDALTFTAENWDTPQPVTVTAVDDGVADGGVTVTLTVAVVAGSSDPSFAGLNAEADVAVVDDDSAGFALTGTDELVVTEAGGTDTFTAALTVQPLTDVVLTVGSGDPAEVAVSPATLTFTPANWDDVQTVTLTGVDDVAADGDQTTTVTVAVDAGASDDAFDDVEAQGVSVVTTDDDAGGFTLAETTDLAVTEAGGTDTFTAVLTAEPGSDVVLTTSSEDTGEVTVDPATLTFTPANWADLQTVTLTGVDDAAADGDQTTTVTVDVDAGASDDAFDGAEAQTVSVVTTDDDAGGFTLAGTEALEVTEAGGTDMFTAVLTAEPGSDVVLTTSSEDTGEVTVDPATLTFTPANWADLQTVTLTGVDDEAVDGDQTTTITVAVDAGASDDEFDGVMAQTASVVTTDDDEAGFALAGAADLEVSEGGGTDTFTAVLTAEPSSDVVLTVSSGDPGEVTVDPATLTFTPANWADLQTVTLTGVDDEAVDGDQTTTITVAVDVGASDDAFDGVMPQPVSVLTTDDEGSTGSNVQRRS